ncbi:MAG: hypothetical protein ABJE66_30395 [Deltaproteobacteria bacterium]
MDLTEPLAIALPDGDLGALADKAFVKGLVEHSEDAPFGEKGETKLDKKVRHAKRLVARGKAIVAGFEPSSVLPAIEKALSPRFHLDAKLEDIIVYEKGGKFVRHKDTPRTANLVGTLVVELPIAHETIVDGGKKHVVDWSGKPARGEVRWRAVQRPRPCVPIPSRLGSRWAPGADAFLSVTIGWVAHLSHHEDSKKLHTIVARYLARVRRVHPA